MNEYLILILLITLSFLIIQIQIDAPLFYPPFNFHTYHLQNLGCGSRI